MAPQRVDLSRCVANTVTNENIVLSKGDRFTMMIYLLYDIVKNGEQNIKFPNISTYTIYFLVGRIYNCYTYENYSYKQHTVENC